MKFLDFYRSMSREERSSFARRVGTSEAYLLQVAHGHRLPGMALAFRIIRESGGAVAAHEDSFGPYRRATTTKNEAA